jgi:uncharacterized membrane protein
VTVERSALKAWLVALLGVPFLLVGVDVLTRRRFYVAFGELIYGTGQVPPIEPRDQIFGAALLVAGIVMVGFGLRELVLPKKTLQADGDGITLAISGPFRRPIRLPWHQVGDIHADVIEEDDEPVPVLVFEVEDPSLLPEDPWGARWIGEREVALIAADWVLPARTVAVELWKIRRTRQEA